MTWHYGWEVFKNRFISRLKACIWVDSFMWEGSAFHSLGPVILNVTSKPSRPPNSFGTVSHHYGDSLFVLFIRTEKLVHQVLL